MNSKTFYGVKVDGKHSEIVRILISGDNLQEAVEAFKIQNDYDLFSTYIDARNFLKQQLTKLINTLNGVIFDAAIRTPNDYDSFESTLKTLEFKYKG